MTAFWTDVVQGKAGRYRCVSPASVDVHLRQLLKAMAAEDDTTRLLDMIEDWNVLLDVRHRSCRFCGQR